MGSGASAEVVEKLSKTSPDEASKAVCEGVYAQVLRKLFVDDETKQQKREDASEQKGDLTPSQQDARRQAAVEQERRAREAEAVPLCERQPAKQGRYSNIHSCHVDVSLWDFFLGSRIDDLLAHTPLVDLNYIVSLIELGGVVPRRQDLPAAALITLDTAWRLRLWPVYALPVLVLSYPWLDSHHPDRLGAQLHRLLPIFKILLENAQCGGPHCTIGLMMDFACLPQKPFADSFEQEQFRRSLKAINEWYFHPYTYVLCVTTAPPEGAEYTSTRLYAQRGWCEFERCAATTVKDNGCVWDFANYSHHIQPHGQPNVGSFHNMWPQLVGRRSPPMTPPDFGDHLRSQVACGDLAFTAKADMELVIEQYRIGFVSAFQYAKSFEYIYFKWGDDAGEVLLKSLAYAVEHCTFTRRLEIACYRGNNFSLEFRKKFEAALGNHFELKSLVH